MFGRGPGDWGASRLVRSRDLIASPLLERRRRRRARAGGAGDQPADAAIRGSELSMSTSRLTSLLAPDVVAATWLPFALPRGLGLARTHRFDCVITSGPPRSAHLVGLALRARGVPWIADFRDGWRFEAIRPHLSQAADRLDRRLEQLVATRADVVTAVTPGLTEDLVSRLGAHAVTVTNGFDPADVVTSTRDGPDLFSPERHSLLYTGSLRPTQFAPFARAFGALLKGRPELASRLEIAFVGPRWEGVGELAEEHGLAGVRWVPPVAREQVLRLQRKADSLLVLLEPDRPGLVTTKLYEYLAADRPMLVVGPDGDAAQVLAEAGGGFCVPAVPEELSWALDRLLAGEPPPPGSAGRNAYSYPQIAARMAEQVEAAIARCAGHGSGQD
jgi:glycosyltransferase involved in cell wall biosynthesis